MTLTTLMLRSLKASGVLRGDLVPGVTRQALSVALAGVGIKAGEPR